MEDCAYRQIDKLGMGLIVAWIWLLLRLLLISISVRLVRHVMANGASASGSQNAMPCHVSCYPANNRTFKAPFSVRRRATRGHQSACSSSQYGLPGLLHPGSS
jgi:hypothetical protein